MKLGPFTIGGEEESEEKYTTTGQMRSLVKQVLLAVSPFVAVGIIGVIGIPTYMVFWAQVIFFAVYLLLIAGVYLNIQREAVTYLCFPYAHMRVGNTSLPPVCLFFKEPMNLDLEPSLKSFFENARVLSPKTRNELSAACDTIKTWQGQAHISGLRLKDPVYAGAFKRFENLILITHSPIQEVFSFVGFSTETLYKDIPVTNSTCELASIQIERFVEVFGQRTAVAYVMESTLRSKNATNLVYNGKEADAAIGAMLLKTLGEVARKAEDVNADSEAQQKEIKDRKKSFVKKFDFMTGLAGDVLEAPSEKTYLGFTLKQIGIILLIVIVGLGVANYFGWVKLPIRWG